MAMMFNPDLLPDSADPEVSTRYGNVNIIHELIESDNESIKFYDNICKDYTFIIEDESPQYNGYECHVFKGTVLKEADGRYSWWKNLKQGDLK